MPRKYQPDIMSEDSEVSGLGSDVGPRSSGSKERGIHRLLRVWMRILHTHRGFFIALLSALCFAGSTVCVRALKDDVGALELVFIRSFCITVLSFICIAYKDIGILIASLGDLKFHLGHALLITSSLCFQFYSFQNMRTADACAILYTYVTLAGLFSRIFLKEPFHFVDGVTCLSSITGAVLIIQPSFIFGTDDGNERDTGGGSSGDILPVLSAVAASVTAALGVVIVRSMTGRELPIPTWRITTYFAVLCMLILFTPITILKEWSVPSCYSSRALVALVGLFSFFGFAFVTYAFSCEATLYVSLASMSEICFVFIFDVTIFGIEPRWLNALGIALIVFSCVFATFYKVYKQRTDASRHSDRLEASNYVDNEQKDVTL